MSLHLIIDLATLRQFRMQHHHVDELIARWQSAQNAEVRYLCGTENRYSALCHDQDSLAKIVELSKQDANESCICKATACARDMLLSVVPSEAYIILIVSSASLVCCTRYSDLIFACGEARKLCNDLQITFDGVSSWFECEQRMAQIKSTSTVRGRRQARLRRMDAVTTE